MRFVLLSLQFKEAASIGRNVIVTNEIFKIFYSSFHTIKTEYFENTCKQKFCQLLKEVKQNMIVVVFILWLLLCRFKWQKCDNILASKCDISKTKASLKKRNTQLCYRNKKLTLTVRFCKAVFE